MRTRFTVVRNYTSSVKTGEKTKDEAISDFYDTIEATYPEITVNR